MELDNKPKTCSCPGGGSSYTIIDPDCPLHGTVAAPSESMRAMTQPNQDAGEELLKRLDGVAGAYAPHSPLCADAAAEIRRLQSIVGKIPAQNTRGPCETCGAPTKTYRLAIDGAVLWCSNCGTLVFTSDCWLVCKPKLLSAASLSAAAAPGEGKSE